MRRYGYFGGLVIAALQFPSALAQEDTKPALEEITVTGRAIEHYQATDALTGTKTAALLMDLPLSIAVVPRQLIDDRALIQLGEALDSVSGAQRKLGYGGTQNFGAYIRGFDSSFLTLRNGLRDFGFYTLRDTAGIERFEVLKGPASVLYGAVYPGGITNSISKQPSSEPLMVAELTGGRSGYYQGRVDMGGPLSESFDYRLNLSYEDNDSFRDRTESHSHFAAPVLRWALSERTSWTLEAEFKQADFTWDLGLPRDPVIFDLPIARFLGETDQSNKIDSLWLSSRLEHRLNEGWLVRQNLSLADAGGDYALRSAFRIEADGRTALRSAYDTREDAQTWVVQHELLGSDLAWLGAGHQIVAGLEYYRNDWAYDFIFRPLASIDIYQPQYSAPETGFPLFASDTRTQGYALYLQDLIALGKAFKLLAGGRYDRVTIHETDTLANQSTRDSADEAFSPQLGLVYQPLDNTSLYASFSRSFVPTGGTKADGSSLDPEEGEQVEIGLKQGLAGGKLSLTLAAFWIDKQQVATPDPNNPLFRVQVGEQQSRGVELDLVGAPANGWDLVLTGAYIDAEVSRDNRFALGSDLPGAPRWSGSLWNKYRFQEGALAGLSLGLGIYSASARQAGLPNYSWHLPSYVRWDAMAAYELGQWRVQLNLKNLSDEKIYDLTSTSIMPQEPRTWMLSFKYRFL